MADNRMFIRCKRCGRYEQIAKYTLLAPYYSYEGVNENLDTFFEEHYFCDKEPIKDNCLEPKFKPNNDIRFDNIFEIAYESYKEKE